MMILNRQDIFKEVLMGCLVGLPRFLTEPKPVLKTTLETDQGDWLVECGIDGKDKPYFIAVPKNGGGDLFELQTKFSNNHRLNKVFGLREDTVYYGANGFRLRKNAAHRDAKKAVVISVNTVAIHLVDDPIKKNHAMLKWFKETLTSWISGGLNPPEVYY